MLMVWFVPAGMSVQLPEVVPLAGSIIMVTVLPSGQVRVALRSLAEGNVLTAKGMAIPPAAGDLVVTLPDWLQALSHMTHSAIINVRAQIQKRFDMISPGCKCISIT